MLPEIPVTKEGVLVERMTRDSSGLRRRHPPGDVIVSVNGKYHRRRRPRASAWWSTPLSRDTVAIGAYRDGRKVEFKPMFGHDKRRQAIGAASERRRRQR